MSQLDGFCDGVVALAEAIEQSLLEGNASEVPPSVLPARSVRSVSLAEASGLPAHPHASGQHFFKDAPAGHFDILTWSLEHKPAGLTPVAHLLHRLLSRLTVILTN